MGRREYKIQLIVNGVFCNRVVIDTHYEAKHGDTISDELILELVKTLGLKDQKHERLRLPFYYFVNDRVDYIGVVNAYRR